MGLSAEGQAAVEAVEAAAAALPELDRESLSFLAAAPGGFGGEHEEMEPPDAGSKVGASTGWTDHISHLFREQQRTS